MTFDNDGRITAIGGSSSPQSLVYGWDAADRIDEITNSAYPSLTQACQYEEGPVRPPARPARSWGHLCGHW